MKAALQCRNIQKIYGDGECAQTVLADVSLSFRPGETCLLLGPSGSGKTTLLSILGCLLTPTSGVLAIEDQIVSGTQAACLSGLRRRRIGFVFQHAQLLHFLTVEENLRIVGRNAGMSTAQINARIDELCTRLKIENCRKRGPAQLSGGQRQRVAIARAVLHSPAIVLADEPTAALDWETGRTAVELLIEQTKQSQAVLLTVTHDARLIPMFDRVLRLDAGRIGES